MHNAALSTETRTGSAPAETARYARCIKASKKVRWEIDADVIRGRDFDFTQTFLPAGLSKVDELAFLTGGERRLLTQVQGQQRFVEQYARDLLQGSHATFEYDYHSRLFDWGERLNVDGQPVHIDQIAYIVDKLKSSSATRRAIAITWNPS